jgi:hypothetical protein
MALNMDQASLGQANADNFLDDLKLDTNGTFSSPLFTILHRMVLTLTLHQTTTLVLPSSE